MATFEDPKVEAIYVAGQKYIDELKAQCRYDEDGILILPAPCYGCTKPVTDIAMITGDGLPLCNECFNGLCRSVCAGTT